MVCFFTIRSSIRLPLFLTSSWSFLIFFSWMVMMDLLLFNPFQSSVVFHIKAVIWFALHIMPGFYMECYTGQRVFITADFKLSLPNCFYGGFVNRTQNSRENSKPFWRLCFGRGSVVCPPPHPPLMVRGSA